MPLPSRVLLTSPPPPCVEIPAPLDRKGENPRRGGAGTGVGAWQAGVSAAGCRQTLPPQLSSPPPFSQTHTLQSLEHLSLALLLRGDRLTEMQEKSSLRPLPQPLVFGPLLRTGMEKKSRHLQSEKPCPSLLPQSLCLSLSSCLFPLAQTGLFPADPEIAPLFQIHSALCLWGYHLLFSPTPTNFLALLLHPH